VFFFTAESARWRRITLVALLVLLASYAVCARGGFPHGGSPAGLAYGIIAAVLLVFLLFFSVRKRWHRKAVGNLEAWCQAHVYFGLLVVVAVLLHTGFRFQDRIAVWALGVMAAVVVSGLFGAVLYTVVPFLLTGAESNIPPEEISSQLNQQALLMTRLVADRSPALREICRRVIDLARPKALAGWRLLLRPPRGNAHGAPAAWSPLLGQVPPADTAQLDQLLVQARQFQELHRSLLNQQRYRNLLAVWLYVHIPLSAALVVLVAAHIAAVFYYAR
jgi:cytochrome b561